MTVPTLPWRHGGSNKSHRYINCWAVIALATPVGRSSWNEQSMTHLPEERQALFFAQSNYVWYVSKL